MDFKKLVWDSGSINDDPELPKDQEPGAQPSVVAPRPVQRMPAGLTALRAGPSATIFERTTGFASVPSNLPSHSTPVVDQEFDAVIGNALEQDSKEPGFKEFTIQLTALSGIITDKGQCASAAVATVSASNPKLNATQITRSIGERLQLLSTYESSYKDDSGKSEQAENQDKRNAISEAEDRIHDLDAEIARFQSERTQLQSHISKLQSELAGVTQKYDGYRGRFHATVAARTDELKKLLGFVAPSK